MQQQPVTIYEQKILNDMKGLKERDQARLARIFHLVRQEIVISEPNEKRMTDAFLSVCGTWEDGRSVEEQIQDIYSARKSTNRTENIF